MYIHCVVIADIMSEGRDNASWNVILNEHLSHQ